MSIHLYDRAELEQTVQTLLDALLGNPLTVERQAEDTLMRYFDEFFYRLVAGNEIATLDAYTEKLAKLSFQKAEHAYTLRFYQAVVASEKQEYETAERMLHALLTADISQHFYARVANALGILYDYGSRFDAAIEMYGRCVAIYHGLGDARGEGKALKNQGIVWLELGEYYQASACFAQAQSLFQQANDEVLESRVLLELGYAARELGHWQQALIHYQRGQQIAQRQADADMMARFSNNLGSIYCFLGMWSEAEAQYQAALQLIHNLPGVEQREIADIYHNLGFLAAVQRQTRLAETYYQTALAHAVQANELTAISELYYRVGCLHQQQDDHQQAYLAYAKGIETVEAMFGQVSQEAIRIGVMGIRQHLYQAMVLCCLRVGRSSEAFSYVQRAKSRAFLDLLNRSSAKRVKYGQYPLSAEQIQAHMPAGSVIVEFFATGHAGASEEMLGRLPQPTQFLRTHLVPDEQLFAFIVTSQRIDVVTLGITLRQLEARHFQRHSGRLRGTDPVPGQPLSSLRWWHQLDTQLLAPLRPYLHNQQHIFFAPHGPLHYLPLHALSNSGQLLDAEVTISYIPSASVLLQNGITAGQLPMDATRSSLAMTASIAIGVDLAGLKHSEAEAAWVAKQLGGIALLGAAATVTNVCQRLSSAHHIHFSCHGHFHNHQAMASALQLADGPFTAADILQSLQLHAQLVTMSACDTGLNPLAHGDELMGLTRAWLGAGARTLLMALWQVAELPTRLFMEYFYQAWLTGRGCADALHSAQKALRTMTITELQAHLARYGLSEEEIATASAQLTKMWPGDQPFHHPYYWGAFIIVGDPS